ncbi:MAG: ACP S-malonyltransferase [Anaerobutyricum sp.]
MNGNIYIANYNCPGQIVVTGEKAVVEASYEIFQKKGAKMVLPLNVSGPFHSPLLETAKKKLEISLKDVQINNFIIPYVSNVNAKYINYSCDIKSLLSEQIVSSVKWQQSIKEMIRQGVDLFIEVGPGSTLTNLIRKIDPGVEVLNIQAVGDMKTLLKVN